MAAPMASRATIVPTTSWRGAPASTNPSPIPANASATAPSQGRASGLRLGSARRSPGGSACLLALLAARIVVSVGAGGFFGFRVVENDAEHADLRLKQLALNAALRRLVLAARPNDVQDAIGEGREQ